jgi:DNA-binding LacI/PurR family transcriptional regulator
MGYLPNKNALSMKNGRSMTIGILSSALAEGWGARIMIGALSAIKDSFYSLRIEAVQGAAEEKQALESLLGSRIEGLFCCNINPTPETDAFFKTATERYDVAVASTNCAFSFPHARVESDNHGGVTQLMEHLTSLGHRRIAHLAGDAISEASRERTEAFLDCVKKHLLNTDDCPILKTDWNIEKARQQTRALLTGDNKPTAILCANDSIAASALQIAHELKIQVPEQLSVVGMTNERISSLTNPEITTVSIPWEDIGSQAIRSLLQSIEEKSAQPNRQLVRCDSTILPRASTAATADS